MPQFSIAFVPDVLRAFMKSIANTRIMRTRMRKARAQGREFENSREFSSSHKLVSCLKTERRRETIPEGFESTEQSKPVQMLIAQTRWFGTDRATRGLSPKKEDTISVPREWDSKEKGRGGKAQAAAV